MGGQKYSSCIDQIAKNAKIVLSAVLFSLSFDPVCVAGSKDSSYVIIILVLTFNQVLEVKKDTTAPNDSSFILTVKEF